MQQAQQIIKEVPRTLVLTTYTAKHNISHYSRPTISEIDELIAQAYAPSKFTTAICLLRKCVSFRFLRNCVIATLAAVGTGVVVSVVWRYAAIGPYPSVQSLNPFAIVNRFLINTTRKEHKNIWYPMNALLTAAPSRSSDNGHAGTGAVRDEARRLIIHAVQESGRRFVELSPASHHVQDVAINQHYAPSDLRGPINHHSLTKDDVLVCIDTDYYARNDRVLLGHEGAFIAHSFQPIAVAGMDADNPFTISCDHVVFDVPGGSSWIHPVWDWTAAGEFTATPVINTWTKWFLYWLGIRKIIVHKVHHCRPWKHTPHRMIVWCIPQYSYWRIGFLPTDMHARRLKHMKYSDFKRPGWNRLNFIEEVSMTSFGRAGESVSCEMPLDQFECLMALENSQSVTARCIALNIVNPIQRMMINAYHRGKASTIGDVDTVQRSARVAIHWPYASEADAPEVSARSYGAPLVSDQNMVPMIKRWETTSQAIDYRVTFSGNVKTPPYYLSDLAMEFVSLVVPEANIGAPYSLEETKTLLDKPSQTLAVNAIWDTLDCEVRRMIEGFIKNEPTNKAGRIISSFPDARFLLCFSSFTLSFRNNVLHTDANKHWFIPGRTPAEIANAVVDYVRQIGEPMEGDYSNFDGSVSLWCHRFIMNAVYHRYFGSQYQTELRKYTDMIISCPARAKTFQFRYDAGIGVKSGSPTTCDLNTVLNGFIQYAAIRRTNKLLTKEEAYRTIGLAFGDDSLFDQQYRRQFNKIAGDLGLNLKVENYDREAGVTFLARTFVDPYTTTTSIQDPLRTWRKLHLTSRDPNVPLSDAARDRVEGYLVTDALSPITSNYCRAVLRCTSEIDIVKRVSRKSADREKPYWFIHGDGSWPQREEDLDLMTRVTAHRTGFEVEVIRSHCELLDTITDLRSGAITLNRELNEIPWSNTILPCGATADPEVDVVYTRHRNNSNNRNCNDNQYEQGRQNIQNRADPITPRTTPGNRQARVNDAAGEHRPGSSNDQRSQRNGNMRRDGDRQNNQGNRQLAGQTPRGNLPRNRNTARAGGVAGPNQRQDRRNQPRNGSFDGNPRRQAGNRNNTPRGVRNASRP